MNQFKLLFIFVILPVVLARNFREKRQEKKCVCVPYYQCGEDGKIDVYATGQLDQRFTTDFKVDADPNPSCSGVDICCELPDDFDSDDNDKAPVDPPGGRKPPIEKPPVDPPTYQPPDPLPGSEIGEPVIPDGLEGCGLKRLNPLNPRIDTDIRIIGKDEKPENTFYGEFPWMVAVFKQSDGRKNFTCGGSLIRFNVVLTAAHCIATLEANQIVVRAGDWDSRNQDEPIPHQDRQVIRISMHKDFDSGNLRNDIALLFLETPFTQSKTVDIICVTKENSYSTDNCQATGWGVNSFSDRGLYQPILKKVFLPIIDRPTCQSRLRDTRLGKYFKLHKSFVCAGGQVNQDTCTGDGGGPLVCGNFDGNRFRYVQIGIVSWGIGCGNGNPAVYASVNYFYDWIYNQI